MTKKQLIYLWQYFLSGGGGVVASDLVMRPNFNDMANLSLTSPSNGSATFNGTSDYVRAATSPIGAASAITITGWINTTQTFSTFKGLVSKGTPNGYEDFIVFGGNTNKLGFYLETNAGSGANIFSTTSINDGRWHHFAALWNSATGAYNLYINGSLEATGSRSGATLSNTDTDLFLGMYSSTINHFAGNLANVAFWNRALTSDEINSIQWKRYDLLTSGESTGLVAWYALDDITGTSVPDSTGTYNATAY